MLSLYIAEYGSYFWFALGLVFMFLEIKLGFSTIYLFFAGLASITVGFMLSYDMVDPNNLLSHVIIFFMALLSYSALLWKPLKYFVYSHNPKDQYSNIIGQTGTVIGAPLKKGKKGEINWSGTTIFAKIHKSESKKEIAVDEDVEIVEIEENVFLVKSKN